jgi:outer membrane protein assembly factor BamB
MLVVGATDGLIRAFNAYSGELIWSTPLNGATIVAPLLASQTIYAATLRAGMLYALDTQTGSVVWSHEVTGRIKSAMATQDGKIIVMAETQQVIMFAPEIPEEVNS